MINKAAEMLSKIKNKIAAVFEGQAEKDRIMSLAYDAVVALKTELQGYNTGDAFTIEPATKQPSMKQIVLKSRGEYLHVRPLGTSVETRQAIIEPIDHDDPENKGGFVTIRGKGGLPVNVEDASDLRTAIAKALYLEISTTDAAVSSAREKEN